jgi:hypothetical protein
MHARTREREREGGSEGRRETNVYPKLLLLGERGLID